MTHQQWESVEQSLAGLTALDKLELVERLVHELRSSAALDRLPGEDQRRPINEAEFKQRLLANGLMSSLPLPRDKVPRPEFEPVEIEGEPLSETIIRERR